MNTKHNIILTLPQSGFLLLAYSFSVCYLSPRQISPIIKLISSFSLFPRLNQPSTPGAALFIFLSFSCSFFISLSLPPPLLVSASRGHALLLAPKRTNYAPPPLLERSRTEVAGISKIALIVGVIFSAGSELSERKSADNNGGCMRWLVDDPVL